MKEINNLQKLDEIYNQHELDEVYSALTNYFFNQHWTELRNRDEFNHLSDDEILEVSKTTVISKMIPVIRELQNAIFTNLVIEDASKQFGEAEHKLEV